MKRIFLIVLISASFISFTTADINPRSMNRDSLRTIVFNNDLPDTTRLRNATYFILTYDYVMPDSMLYYSRMFYEQSVRAGYLYGIAYTAVTEGWYYAMVGQNKEAMKFYLGAIKPAEEYGDPLLLAFVYGEVGTGYQSLQVQDKAIEFQLRSIKIYEDLKLPIRKLRRMVNLAYVYADAGNLQKSTEILKDVIATVDSMGLEIYLKSASLDKLGTIYKDSGDTIAAARTYTEALRLHKQANNPYFYRITLNNLINILIYDKHNALGKVIGDNRPSTDITLSYLQEFGQLSRDARDTGMLVKCYVLMAKAYLTKGENKKALDYLAESQKLNTGNLSLEPALNYTKYLIEFYSALGDYKKAFEQSNNLLTLLDSLDKVKMAEKVSLLTESFELEKMEGQLSQKEEQLNKNRVITFLFVAISALILVLAGITLYFLRQKQKAARLLERQNREIEQARARAEQSEKFKEQFLARMSHEIRTPLNAVIGMTGLLLDESQPPKTENYLKSIKQAGEHLTGIINEILDLSKIDAGKLELYETPFNMQNLLKEIENLFETRVKEKELELIVEKSDGSPDWFMGDSNRIRQVLVNLVGNAVKFTDQGSVQVKMTADDIREDKAMITFSVEDTGPGIPKEAQAKIFEEFVQAGQAGDQKVAGTGLGLSIVRKLVSRMGGTLALESEPGKGSAFSFTVPLALSSEEAWKALQKEKDLALTAIKGAYRILVVEDNPSNQIVTEGMLEKILPEAKTIIAESGLKALELLEKEKFALVLMDIRMPGIDGYETTRRLRLLKNDNAIVPVIALTASVIRVDIQRCLDAGMNGYVPKPVPRGALAKAIREQLKITGDENYIPEEAKEENFLERIKDRPAWSDRLFELCNGKKERFMKYLDIFITQAESETGSWQTLTEQQQHEPLAFSVHKLLPYIRIFMDEKTVAAAIALDLKLRKGWDDGLPEELMSLKEDVLRLRKEAEAFAGLI